MTGILRGSPPDPPPGTRVSPQVLLNEPPEPTALGSSCLLSPEQPWWPGTQKEWPWFTGLSSR